MKWETGKNWGNAMNNDDRKEGGLSCCWADWMRNEGEGVKGRVISPVPN